MRLVIRAVKVAAEAAFDGRTIALFLEDGTALPNQVAISTSFDAESGQSHVTVTFAVDGKEVRFE